MSDPKTTPPEPIQAAIYAAQDAIEWQSEAMATPARWAVATFLRALPECTTIAIAADGERRIRTASEVADMVSAADAE